MTEKPEDKWNARYSEDAYAYGRVPNLFFKDQLGKLEVGNILLGAEGEGRNAVYAATLGWTVSAFDISEAGKAKAMKLAEENNVSIDYQIGELADLSYPYARFDAIALIYAHFPPNLKSKNHRILDTLLRPGGTVIFEAFGKNHLEYRRQNEKVGGPADLEFLFSVDELKTDFKNYDIELLEEREIELNEGKYHNGKGSVVRFLGRKKF